MNIFGRSDYRDICKEVLLEKKTLVGTSFTFQAMAKACSVQKTYLSKVLNGDGHLSHDQLYQACRYLAFNEDEGRFVFLLRDHMTTSVKARKAEIAAEIHALRAKQLKTEARLKLDALPSGSADVSAYYLDPYCQIVHMFLTVPRYCKNVRLIAPSLGIQAAHLSQVLRKLETIGVVEIKRGQYQIVKDMLHLTKDSPIYKAYRSLLRAKSNDWLDRDESGLTYSFSVIFSCTPKERLKIHAMFLEFLAEVQKAVKKAASEEIYQMNFDLFSWSEVDPPAGAGSV